MNVRTLVVTGAAMVFGLAACNTGTEPSAGIDAADVNQLANDIDALSITTLGSSGATAMSPSYSISPSDATPLATVNTINRTFSNSHACPAGGTVSISGSVTGTSDPAAQNLSITTSATKTDADCAFNTKHGVLTLNGNPNVEMTGTVNIVAGKPVGLQTMSHKGSYTWKRNGNTGTCNVDVSSAYDPSAGTITVTGTMCGRTVSVSRTGPRFP
jgi:hypothetical protein